MNPEHQLISDITVYSKYARWWGELGRRETFEEIVARNRQMHLDHIESLGLETEQKESALRLTDEAYKFVFDRKVFPSMRSFQFGGEPIFRNNSRIYNCAFRFADEPSFFGDLMYLLLGGTGVGFSVQKQHVAELPEVHTPDGETNFTIDDSIEGWAYAVEALVNAYFTGSPKPVFDYSEIRPQGALLKTSGGRAPGPDPLRRTLDDLEATLAAKNAGDKMRPIEVHDMATFIARAVLSGGIRRSAMISLFSPDDEEMLEAKSGAWWEVNPDRAYANNSAVLLRGRDDELFHDVFQSARDSGAGEPGVYWVDDLRYGTNPCAEITLNNKQFCNLTTMNVGTVESQEDFNARARAAAIIGTLQASYTNFPFLSEGWKEQTEEERLLGVSMTGVASRNIENLDGEEAANAAVEMNAQMADLLGITPAARVTAIKPEGTASLVAGTASGIHAWHDPYYIRRMRFNKSEPIAQYLMEKFGIDEGPIVEEDVFNPQQIVVAVPQKAPEGALTREEGAAALLERVRRYHHEWIRPGNRYGGMPNNISATINIKDEEWDYVHDWMWENREEYNGLSLLPHSDHTYQQAPFETVDKNAFEAMAEIIRKANLDFKEIDETEDHTDLTGEIACAGGACEIPIGYLEDPTN